MDHQQFQQNQNYNSNMEKGLLLGTLIILISSFLLGCSDKKNSSNISKKIFFSSFDNEILELKINSDGVEKRDTLNISNKFTLNNLSDYNNNIFEGYLVGSFNPIYNFENEKILLNDTGVFISKKEDSIYYYNIKKKKIFWFSLKDFKHEYLNFKGEFFLPAINRLPSKNFISKNLKKVVLIETNDTIRQNLNKEYVLQIYDYEKDSILNKIPNIKGTVMSGLSSTESTPSVIWINDFEFIYTSNSLKDNLNTCSFMKFNIKSKLTKKIGKPIITRLSTKNGRFINDEIGNIFYLINGQVFNIDLKNNNISKEIEFDKGNSFVISIKDGKTKILHKGETIKDIKDENILLLNANNCKSSENSIFFIEDKTGDIWFEDTKKWKKINLGKFDYLLGF
ncbi:hypothetical protein NHF50_01030 [Flavobacterium sp. NRK F10]|uniref:hypothetical protein n=1 Tax=Flavobacterium sp. NRK F10 TaxID=2954931 RepID=UPI0020911840|nr:hypothetical protein [Flavobacterium sp. NRK F10]MCO6173619.1 hypothetical protein [Flavobacterium sp. NRK F10]